MKDPRFTHTVMRVMRCFLVSQTEMSGADISRATGIHSGTVHPILVRLEKAGWVFGMWEDLDPRVVGRPRRKLFLLTHQGESKLRAVLLELGITVEPPPQLVPQNPA